MGVANPDRETAGLINKKAPKIACCCVEHKEEMNRPTPTIELTNTNMLRYRSNKDPVKGIWNTNTAANTMIVPSAIPIKMAGKALPIRISNGIIGDTSN